jgi:Zn-finger nucleic acid-binding protein
MYCPRCHVELGIEMHKDIEVDRCPACGGMWLDYGELDQLEDTVYDKDELKGSLMFRSFDSELVCSKCEGRMQCFNYRAYNLELDFCEQGHGAWLDAGEEKQVVDFMKQRIKDLDRKGKAENEWEGFLAKLGSPSFIDKAKRLFRK